MISNPAPEDPLDLPERCQQLPDAARERALEAACELLGERFWDGCRYPTLPLITTLLARMQPGDAKYFAGQQPPAAAVAPWRS